MATHQLVARDGGSAAAFNAIDDKVRSLQGRYIALRHPVIVIEAPSKPIANTCLVVAEGLLEHDFDSKSSRSSASVPTLGQVDDLMSVDTEDHLLLIRQLDDEFQLLAGRMHQLDSHIALDLGNFSAEDSPPKKLKPST